MKRKSNIGVTMVEVLIALAIFLILLMPLVSALMTGMRSTTTAKESQERNDYVRNLMEHVKEMPSSVLMDNNEVAKYFTNLGAEDVSCVKWSGRFAGTNNEYERYVITGKARLGIKDAQYAYTIEVSNKDYADASLVPVGYIDPNTLTSGVVEDFDRMDVALISAPFANYDYPAFDSLMTRKMDELRKRQEKNGVDFDPQQGMKIFAGNQGERNITVKVSGDKTRGYTVQCILQYSDDCREQSSVTAKTIRDVVGSIEYVPYVQTFKKLPNIYLMYNSCVYNGQYAKDTITLDIDDLDTTDIKDVNLFVVATAASYKTDVVTAAGEESVDLANGTLYRPVTGDDRGNQNVTFASKGNGRNFLNIYHNISEPLKSVIIAGMPVASYNENDFKQVGSLTDALNNRGLYEVRIWMQKESAGNIDMANDSPILQGTRGGDEIE